MNHFHNEYKKFLSSVDGPELLPKQKKKFNKSIRRQFATFVLSKKLTYKNDRLQFRSILVLHSRNKSKIDDLISITSINIRSNSYILDKFKSFKLPILGTALYIVDLRINPDNIAKKGIHHNIFLFIHVDENYKVKKKLKYSQLTNLFNDKAFNYKNKRILDVKGQAVFLRQSAKNNLTIVVRKKNTSDALRYKLQILATLLLSYPVRLFWRPVLLYEKESQQFEESASVLFDRVQKKQYDKNVYYVLSERSKFYKKVSKTYGKNILRKHSFKHYLAFFSTKTFIGTEAISHSIDLRIANRFASRKVFSMKNNYVFLQHGVTYMVSLASKYRKFARRDTGIYPTNTKIVVSSDKEKQHFIEVGKFKPDSFYISGMPKFDTVRLNNNPSRITIMPTWRPWEYNTIQTNPTETSYFEMVQEIMDAIPKNLKKHTTLLPHPLFYDSFLESDLRKYIVVESTHDEVLRDTKILITDYSSVAYDAFYRGSDVVFWWKDIEECEEKYAGPILIKNEEPFGTIVNNKKELTAKIPAIFSGTRNKKFDEAFKKIVAFRDNGNTDRLIKMLRDDNII